MLLPSLLGPKKAAHLLVIGLWILLPVPSKHGQRLSLALCLPRPYPSSADATRKERIREGEAQFILLYVSSLLLPPGPDLAHQSPPGWPSSLAGQWSTGVRGCWWMWGMVIRWQENSWNNEQVGHWAARDLLDSTFLAPKDRNFKMNILKTSHYKNFSNISKMKKHSIMKPLFHHSASRTTLLF